MPTSPRARSTRRAWSWTSPPRSHRLPRPLQRVGLALVGVAYALVFFCALGLFGLLRYADTKRTLGPPPPDAVKIRAKQVGSCSVVVWLALSLAIIVFVNFFHFFNQCEGALRTVSGL